MIDHTGSPDSSYHLVKVMARGDLGQVFCVRDPIHGHYLAIKVFHADLSSNTGFLTQFHQQQAALPPLQHANMTKVIDIGIQHGRCYLSMEWCAEGSLRVWLNQRSRQPNPERPLALYLDLVRQAADALAVAHTRGMRHRNLKPGNLLLTHADNPPDPAFAYTVKISDIGLRQSFADMHDQPGGISLETLAYAPPEWFTGDSLNAQSDIYALGVILYEIVAGHRPFTADDSNTAYAQHLFEAPPPLREYVPDLPAALEQVIIRCLEKTPAARFENAAELATALEEIVCQLPPPPAPVRAPVTHATPTTALLPRLIVLNEETPAVEPQRLLITGQGLKAGRDPSNEIHLPIAELAEQQLEIFWDGKRVRILNLEDNNLIRLGSKPLGLNVEEFWVWNTTLEIGCFRLRVQPPTPADTGTQILPGTPADPGQTALVLNGDTTRSLAPVRTSTIEDTVGLRCLDPDVELTPGQDALLKLTIFYMGSRTAHFETRVEGVPPTWIRTVTPKEAQINPPGEKDVILTIQAPRVPESKAGNYLVTIVVTSRDNPEVQCKKEALWHVLPFNDDQMDLHMRRHQLRGRGFRWKSGTLIVRNQGNEPVRAALKFVDPEEQLRYRFIPEGQDHLLQPGQEVPVKLQMRPRGTLWGRGTKFYPATVRSSFTSTANMSVRREGPEREAQFEHIPFLPYRLFGCLGSMIGMAFGLFILFIGLRFYLQPRINYVRSCDPAVEGAPVTICWETNQKPGMSLQFASDTLTAEPIFVNPGVGSYTFATSAPPSDLKLVARSLLGNEVERFATVTIYTPTPFPTLPPPPAPQTVVVAVTAVTAVTVQPTPVPTSTATPVLQTATSTTTATPFGQISCLFGDVLEIRGNGPPRTPFLVYFDQRAIAGGVTETNGEFFVSLGDVNHPPGTYSIAVQNRDTSEPLTLSTVTIQVRGRSQVIDLSLNGVQTSALTCIVPSPTPTRLPATATPFPADS